MSMSGRQGRQAATKFDNPAARSVSRQTEIAQNALSLDLKIAAWWFPNFGNGSTRLNWQFENERRAVTGSVAVGAQRSAHFLGRQRAAVQAEAVAIFARGKTVVKDPRQIFRGNANPVVGHRYFNPASTAGHAHCQSFVRAI
jgi:hypothetical protein